jgi:hypothetical protein
VQTVQQPQQEIQYDPEFLAQCERKDAYSKKMAEKFGGCSAEFIVNQSVSQILIPLSVYNPEVYEQVMKYIEKE